MTQPFVDVNEQRLTRLQRQHPNLTRIHPGVVRRGHAEPGLSQVEGFVANGAKAQAAVDALLEEPRTPSERPEPVAGKKKRARVDANTRSVGVARVDKLISAGNPAGKAIASVAKELGVSESAVINWRTAAKKAGPVKLAKKTAKEPATEPVAHVFDGLGLILDIIELAERAKKGLSKSQRARLRAALNERLS
jgi:transposase-like protein